jgi:orotidine-5'-phosphate decarboxylase
MTELIIAADVSEEAKLGRLMVALQDQPVWLKVGLEALSAFGLDLVRRIRAEGFKVFADVKFHDIPNTVGAASKVLAATGANLFNVHCSGGRTMCEAARKQSEASAAALGLPRPKVIGVTVLTSLGPEDLAAIGMTGTPADMAVRLARVGREGGLDGVVCSVHEAAAIKAACGADFLTVCPGIRPAGSGAQDQKRVATPADAVRAGADYIVVGRPVTGADDPAAACRTIIEELGR